MEEYENEIKEIERVTKTLYSSICFEAGGKPALENLRTLFIAEGKLINNNDNFPVIKTVDQYIEAFKQRLSTGSLKAFYEGEISSRTELFGKIAHRFSTYETKFDLSASESFSIGINSIQFIKINQLWLVSSIAWNDQTENCAIPRKYL